MKTILDFLEKVWKTLTFQTSYKTITVKKVKAKKAVKKTKK